MALTGTAAAEAPSSSTACTTPAVSQVFSSFNDSSYYTLVPGADAESGWNKADLTAGSALQSGNEPWYVGGSAHRSSLYIPSGGTATTRAMCVGTDYPYMRFFLRNTGTLSSQLALDVLYLDSAGRLQSRQLTTQSRSATSWAVTSKISISAGLVASKAGGLAPVAFRFRALGTGGKWSVDDVYIDPRRRS